MARFAPVVPVHIARQLQEAGVLGSYHLLLAHDVLEHENEYREIYGHLSARTQPPNSVPPFIIMDNSVVELGIALPLKDLLHAATIARANCIVAPDVMGDGPATARRAVTFCGELVDHKNNHPHEAHFDIMGVVQGSTLHGCLETLGTYLKLPIAHLGIPRVITAVQGSRMPLLEILTRRLIDWPFSAVHLLGFSDDILDDVACARMSIVSGIDSAVPIRAAVKPPFLALRSALDQPTGAWSRKLGPRGDYWTKIVPHVSYTLLDNLRAIRGWIKDPL